MADVRKKYAENVDGNFFVDTTCINCDTCRQLAPDVFDEKDGDYSFVFAQPTTDRAALAALQALIACPTSSIGTTNKMDIKHALDTFPMRLEDGVYYCGFNSEKSFGGHSYFVQRAGGNWLIDSPRFTPHLTKKFERLGGIQYIFLTHQDDVADAAKYAAHFNAERYIHQRDLHAQRDSEHILDGTAPIDISSDILILPTPGHTAGHCVMLYKNQFLFSGDHVWWSRRRGGLSASRNVCWHSWAEQIASMEKLRKYSFEWILPGHGERKKASASEMSVWLDALISRMKTIK